MSESIKVKLIWPSKEIKKLVDQYNELEKQINEKLEKMPNNGRRCDCEEPEIFYYIFHGHNPEIMMTCIKCGGFIE